jgi:hypothetical protein
LVRAGWRGPSLHHGGTHVCVLIGRSSLFDPLPDSTGHA